MAEKELTARVRVQADDAQPIDKIEKSLRDLDGAGRKAKGGLDQAATGADRADREIDQLERQVRELSRALDFAKRDLEEFKRSGRGIDGLAKSVGTLKAAFAGLGIGLGVEALRRGFGFLLETSRAQVDALAQVEAAIKSTGGAAGLTRPQLEEMASGLQKVTTFGDEVVLKMQSVLLTFKSVGSDIFPRASEVILDVATRLDTDLKSAAIQVGKALEDPIKGVTSLGRAGVQFTDAQREMIKGLVESGDKLKAQEIVLGELETQFGGAARAARKEFGGALDAAKNAAGDLLEKIGEGGLSDALARLADRFTTSAQGSDDFATKIGQVLGLVVEVVGGAITGIKAGFEGIAGAVGIGVSFVGEQLLALSGLIADGLSNLPGFGDVADRIKADTEQLRGILKDFREKTQKDTERDLRQAKSSLGETVDNIVKIFSEGGKKAKDASADYGEAGKGVSDLADGISAAAPKVKAAVDEINKILGKLPGDAKANAAALTEAWESFDPSELRRRFAEASDASREELREKFLADVEAIKAAGGEVTQEMVTAGQQIGALVAAYKPASESARDTADAMRDQAGAAKEVGDSAEEAANSIPQWTRVVDEQGRVTLELSNTTRLAADNVRAVGDAASTSASGVESAAEKTRGASIAFGEAATKVSAGSEALNEQTTRARAAAEGLEAAGGAAEFVSDSNKSMADSAKQSASALEEMFEKTSQLEGILSSLQGREIVISVRLEGKEEVLAGLKEVDDATTTTREGIQSIQKAAEES